MENLWGELVDQVAFVDYNPWENCYEKKKMIFKKLVAICGEGCSFGGMVKLILAMLIISRI